MDIQRFPKLNRKKLYNCLLSRALRALDNIAADAIHWLFGAKRLTTSGFNGQPAMRASSPVRLPLIRGD